MKTKEEAIALAEETVEFLKDNFRGAQNAWYEDNGTNVIGNSSIWIYWGEGTNSGPAENHLIIDYDNNDVTEDFDSYPSQGLLDRTY